MIQATLVVGSIAVGFAFAAGCYVGWKTTMKVIDSVEARRKVPSAV